MKLLNKILEKMKKYNNKYADKQSIEILEYTSEPSIDDSCPSMICDDCLRDELRKRDDYSLEPTIDDSYLSMICDDCLRDELRKRDDYRNEKSY